MTGQPVFQALFERTLMRHKSSFLRKKIELDRKLKGAVARDQSEFKVGGNLGDHTSDNMTATLIAQSTNYGRGLREINEAIERVKSGDCFICTKCGEPLLVIEVIKKPNAKLCSECNK